MSKTEPVYDIELLRSLHQLAYETRRFYDDCAQAYSREIAQEELAKARGEYLRIGILCKSHSINSLIDTMDLCKARHERTDRNIVIARASHGALTPVSFAGYTETTAHRVMVQFCDELVGLVRKYLYARSVIAGTSEQSQAVRDNLQIAITEIHGFIHNERFRVNSYPLLCMVELEAALFGVTLDWEPPKTDGPGRKPRTDRDVEAQQIYEICKPLRAEGKTWRAVVAECHKCGIVRSDRFIRDAYQHADKLAGEGAGKTAAQSNGRQKKPNRRPKKPNRLARK